MAAFEMCPACLAEYRDPANRRFHAQPNACPDCGPQVRLVYAGGGAVEDSGARDAVEATARALLDGAIVAVKGIGGFHLACRADDEAAVAELRARKHREDKPFALMAPDLGTVARARGSEAAGARTAVGARAADRPCAPPPGRPRGGSPWRREPPSSA